MILNNLFKWIAVVVAVLCVGCQSTSPSPSVPTATPERGNSVVPGTVAGIIVNTPDNGTVSGTVFVANVGWQKKLCTVGHIAQLANMYGVNKISDEFKLTGDFVQIGDVGGVDSIMCAPVTTNWSGYNLLGRVMSPGQTTVTYSVGKQTTGTVEGYEVIRRKPLFEELGGIITGMGLKVLNQTLLVASDSGSPMALQDDPYTIVSVLGQGDESRNYYVPYRIE